MSKFDQSGLLRDLQGYQPINMTNFNKDKWESNFITAPQAIGDELSEFIDIEGKKVVDFGCGLGIKTLGVASQLAPNQIIGLDVIDQFRDLEQNAKAASISSWPRGLSFKKITPGEPIEIGFRPDCIFSWSVFEHIRQDLLPRIFQDHYDLLADDGYIFLQINPLYYSPYGSHLGSWINEPWAHLRHQTNVLQEMLNISNQNSDLAGILAHTGDDALSFKPKPGPWNCFRTLNKITVSQLKTVAMHVGFEIVKTTTSKTQLVPDESLLEVYQAEVLLTEGVRLVMRKRRG